MGAAVDRLRKLSGSIAGFTLFAGAAALLTPRARRPLGVPSWLLWLAAPIGAAITVKELVGKPVPFLRWSVLTMMLRGRHLLRSRRLGTVGKRRWRNTSWPAPAPVTSTTLFESSSLRRHVSYLINVGDEKGKILDNAVERTQPRRLLELGTYCGYSALRMARAMPREARLYSVEFNTANAVIARRILAHAGVDDRVTVLVGTLGDGGETVRLEARVQLHPRVARPGLPGPRQEGLRVRPRIDPRSAVAASRLRRSGGQHLGAWRPAYRAHMRDNDGTLWHTTEHRTHAEYQSMIKDVVLESDYLGT